MRRRMTSPSNTTGSRCDENLTAVLDEIALGQPLLTDDIKPAFLDDEVPAAHSWLIFLSANIV